jgi:hypothetical protein
MVWLCSEGTPGYNGFGANPFGFGGHITTPLTGADRARDQAWRRRTSAAGTVPTESER